MGDLLSGLNLNAWGIAGAVGTLLATWVLVTIARRGTRAGLRRLQNLSDSARVAGERIVGYTIWLIGFAFALTFLGVSVQPLIAVAIVVGVVLVLVLRGIADNFAAGVVLQTRRPITVGDEIESGEVIGTVTELNGRSVVIHTTDGRTVHLPNAEVLSTPLTNNSEQGARRSEIEVRIERTDDDRSATRDLVCDAAAGAEGVLAERPVRLRPITLGAAVEVYRVRFWHHPMHAVAVTDAVVDAVAGALADAGVRAVVTSEPSPTLMIPPVEP